MEELYVRFAIQASVIFLFAFLVFRYSYGITLENLKGLYYTFLIYVSWVVFGFFLQSIPQDLLYDNIILCHILGRHSCIQMLGLAYLLSLFNYYKTRLYIHLAEESSALRKREKYLKAAMIMMPFLLLVYLALCDSGRVEDLWGNESCVKESVYSLAPPLMFAFIFFASNIYMMTIFFRYERLRHESIPQLEFQMKLNARVVPIMFITTSIVYAAQICYTPGICPYASIWVGELHYVLLLDSFLNTYIMYRSLFYTMNRNSNFIWPSGDDVGYAHSEIEFVDNSDDFFNFSEDPVEDELWVALPGAHPIKCSFQLIIQESLVDYVVTNEKRLRQIERYERRGFIPSLTWGCCYTSDELEIRTRKMNNKHDAGTEQREPQIELREPQLILRTKKEKSLVE